MVENPIFLRIKQRLDELDRNPMWLSRQSGVAYHKLTNLQRRPNATLRDGDSAKLAIALEVKPEWLLEGDSALPEITRLRSEIDDELDQLSEEELRGLLVGIKSRRA